LIATGNYLAGGAPTLRIEHWQNLTFTGNTVTGNSTDIFASSLLATEKSAWNWNSNAFYYNGSSTPFVGSGSSSQTFSQWKSDTGFDSASSYASTLPPNAVFIRPNQYEAGRANIVVYNWARQNSVSLNLSTAGLTDGQNFEIRDTRNYFGTPVFTGTYNSSNPVISLPMNIMSVAPRLGPGSTAYISTEFGAFILLGK
jgi:hypothetical protein